MTDRNLTKADLLKGGDRALEPMEIKALQKEGGAGIIHMKPMPAGKVMAFSKLPVEEQTNAMIKMMAKAIVDEEGEPLFKNEEEAELLLTVRADAFLEIQAALLAMMNMGDTKSDSKAGEASGEATTSASPTDSPSN